MTPRIRALIFDFDGLILETEMPAYRSWAEIYREHGHELPRDRWMEYIGREAGWFDALTHLESLVAAPLDRVAVRSRREAKRAELLAELDVMAGIRDYVADAGRLGLRLAVASSSPSDYVRTHLRRLALDDVWDAVVCREDAPRAKPAPDLYLCAVDLLGVAPGEALALEDSPNGIASAKDAGLWVVAVPNALTAEGDLSRADWRVSTCAELSLEDLLRRIG